MGLLDRDPEALGSKLQGGDVEAAAWEAVVQSAESQAPPGRVPSRPLDESLDRGAANGQVQQYQAGGERDREEEEEEEEETGTAPEPGAPAARFLDRPLRTGTHTTILAGSLIDSSRAERAACLLAPQSKVVATAPRRLTPRDQAAPACPASG
jgi:hypothetical protein